MVLKYLFIGRGQKTSDGAQLVWLKPRILAQVVESCRTVMANTSNEEELEPLVEGTVRILDAVLYLNSEHLGYFSGCPNIKILAKTEKPNITFKLWLITDK